uniref:Uncharacterized protein n=1 Tax=Anguilla anguilla TaxID=7936 RepID=A0A0E9QQV8_ANGAN
MINRFFVNCPILFPGGLPSSKFSFQPQFGTPDFTT